MDSQSCLAALEAVTICLMLGAPKLALNGVGRLAQRRASGWYLITLSLCSVLAYYCLANARFLAQSRSMYVSGSSAASHYF